jgi:hypothetical protein
MINRYLVRGSVLIAFLLIYPAFTYAATLSVSPSTGSYQVGATITATILVDTTGGAADGVDILYLNFNPALLQVIDENTTTAGTQITPGILMPNTAINSTNNSTGQISFSQVPSGGNLFTSTGAQTLATVRFTVIGAGTAPVTFNHTLGSTSDSNVSTRASGGSDLLTAVTNGSYTLTNVPINNPPVVSPVTTNVADVNSGIPGIQYYEGTTVTYSGVASDPDLDPLTWSWYYTINGGSRILNSSGSGTVLDAVFTYGIGTAGSIYQWILSVTDGQATTERTLDVDIIAALDTTPPVITSVASSGITTSSATITWTTNEVSDSQVEYGVTTAYGNISSLNTSLVTSHSLVLPSLSANTTYNYRVRSRDSAGNLAVSLNRTFTTQPLPDTTPPNTISDLTVSTVDTTSADISWTSPADPPGNGSAASYDIRYATFVITDSNFPSASTVAGEPAPTTPGISQSYIVAGLTPSTLYYVAIRSTDSNNNTSFISNVISFTTTSPPDTTPPTVSITSPTSAEVVAGIITITANAFDNVGVAGVQFQIDNSTIGVEDTSAPYSISWNTATVLDGNHVVTAIARDAAGNTVTSSGITFEVLNNPPPPFDFSLANSGNKSVVQGSSITNTVTATLISGTTQQVTYSVSGLPTDATGAFVPTFCDPGCSTIITITTLTTTPAGNYTITVTGTDGLLTRSTSFQLTVAAPPSTKFTINDVIAVQSAGGGGVTVYDSASLSGTLLTTQPDGTLATIIGGPIFQDGINWWQIDYNTSGGVGQDIDGWSNEDNIETATFSSGIIFSPDVEGSQVSSRNFEVMIVQRTSSTTLHTFTAQPDAQSEIVLDTHVSNVLEGTYNILIRADSFLRKFLRDVVITSNTTISLPKLFGGDFNNDGIINSLDWSFMNIRWFTSDAVADLNRDTVVNSVDYSYLNKNWFTAGD